MSERDRKIERERERERERDYIMKCERWKMKWQLRK
jgi:hypothetical protein